MVSKSVLLSPAPTVGRQGSRVKAARGYAVGSNGMDAWRGGRAGMRGRAPAVALSVTALLAASGCTDSVAPPRPHPTLVYRVGPPSADDPLYPQMGDGGYDV